MCKIAPGEREATQVHAEGETGKIWDQKQQLHAQCEGGGGPVVIAVNQPRMALPCQGQGKGTTVEHKTCRMRKSTLPCVLNFGFPFLLQLKCLHSLVLSFHTELLIKEFTEKSGFDT